jgi:TonB family protein
MQLVLKTPLSTLRTHSAPARFASLNRAGGAVSRIAAWQRLGVASFVAMAFHATVIANLFGLSPLSASQISQGGNGFVATIVPLASAANNLPAPKLIANTADLSAIKLSSPATMVAKEIDARGRLAAAEAAWQTQYRLTSSLEKRPQPLVDVQPIYPAKAGKMRGSVLLRLFVNEFGDVDKVIIVSAKPEGVFEEAAIEAFQNTKFSPGTILGAPVKSQLMLNVDFSAFTID